VLHWKRKAENSNVTHHSKKAERMLQGAWTTAFCAFGASKRAWNDAWPPKAEVHVESGPGRDRSFPNITKLAFRPAGPRALRTLKRGSSSPQSPCPVGAAAEVHYGARRGPGEDRRRLASRSRASDRHGGLCADPHQSRVERRLRSRESYGSLESRSRPLSLCLSVSLSKFDRGLGLRRLAALYEGRRQTILAGELLHAGEGWQIYCLCHFFTVRRLHRPLRRWQPSCACRASSCRRRSLADLF
jgi:hypothetical protein